MFAIAAFAATVSLLAGWAWVLHFAPDRPLERDWIHIDFQTQIYYPTSAFLAGDNPYDTEAYKEKYQPRAPYAPYLPLNLLLYSPFALLPLDSAEVAYFLLVVALTLGLSTFALRFAGVQATAVRVFGLTTLLLMSRAGYSNTLAGQQAVQLSLCCYLALYFAERRPWLAALGLALALGKPSFGGPLALLMLARGDVRPVFAAGAFAVSLSFVPLLMLAPSSGGLVEVTSSMIGNYAAWNSFVNPLDHPGAFDVSALGSHLLQRPLSVVEEAVLMVIVMGAGVLLVRSLAKVEDGSTHLLSSSVICVVLLYCTYHQAYDLLLVTFIGVALVAGTLVPGLHERSWLRWLMLGLVVFPPANYLATHMARSALDLTGIWQRVPSMVNSVAVLGLFMVLSTTVVRFVRRRDDGADATGV